MTNRDEKLDRLFKSLPRELAGDDFTGRVIQRLEKRRPPVFSIYKLALVSATAAVVAAATVFSVSYFEQRAERDQLRRELDVVKTRYTEIAGQLDTLQNQPPADPLIYVGSDDQADYVLDISKLHIRVRGRRLPEFPQASPNGTEVIDLGPGYPTQYPFAEVIQASYKGGAI